MFPGRFFHFVSLRTTIPDAAKGHSGAILDEMLSAVTTPGHMRSEA